HNRCFIKWLKHHIDEGLNKNADSVSKRLKLLADCQSIHVLSYSGYLFNGFTFYTEKQDDQSKMQNSGVTIIARTLHISSAKIETQFMQICHTFGSLNKYGNWITQCFGCRFFVYHRLNKYSVSDPTNKKWFIVLLTNKIILNNINDREYEDIDAEDDPFFGISLSRESGPTTNDDLYTRDDHDEGLWVNEILTRKDNDITSQKYMHIFV
ncbi:hypothetical protein Lal_00035410, partial [Lupinus albus]